MLFMVGESFQKPEYRMVGSVSFVVEGKVPSKENYRRNSKNGRERWARIKAFEEKIGQVALVAAGRHRKAFFDAPLSVTIEMSGQAVDLDNVKLVRRLHERSKRVHA